MHAFWVEKCRWEFSKGNGPCFKDIIGEFMAYYQADMTIHSKLKEYHIKHLRNVLECCRMYGISLNPNKFLFVVWKGKLLGHIVRKEVIYIDLEIIKSINDLNPPTYKKGVQSFFGKINCVWCFSQKYDTIVNPINKLLKKD